MSHNLTSLDSLTGRGALYNNAFFAKTFEVGNVRVGGSHSQIPTVLIGSIFYMRHKIVKDEMSGDFDENRAAH